LAQDKLQDKAHCQVAQEARARDAGVSGRGSSSSNNDNGRDSGGQREGGGGLDRPDGNTDGDSHMSSQVNH